jgi:uncharacterized membrane protein (UPF0127 family)
MQFVNVENLSQALETPILVDWCQSFLCRFRGLMFRSTLASNRGLLLVQNRETRTDAAIHMLFMRIDIAAVWIDSDFEVVDVQIARRWRPLYSPKAPAKYILELAIERFDEFKLGDRIHFEHQNLD